MGKNGRAKWGQGYDDYSAYSQPSRSSEKKWQLWEGAWSPQWRGQQGKWEDPKPAAFPAYDDKSRAIQLKDQGQPRGGQSSTTAQTKADDPGAAVTQGLQDCINVTRKAEQRVRSLTATRQQKQKLWTAYVEDMKKTWLRECARHQKDMDRLTNDLNAALEAQEQARANCRAVVLREEHGPTQAAEQETEEDQAWDAMIEEWKAEQAERDTAGAVLQRALGHGPSTTSAPISAPLTHQEEPFSTPPRRLGSLPPTTPPAPTMPASSRLSAQSSHATADPYQMSPSMQQLRDLFMQAARGAPVVLPPEMLEAHQASPRQRPKHQEVRQPIKKLPTAVPHSTSPSGGLSTKLAQKREQYLAMDSSGERHGRIPGPPAEPPPAAPPDMTPTGSRPIQINDDDNSDEDMPTPGTASTGVVPRS
ncbi:CYTB5-A [Symbiodinium sp. CCMP2592]|nr:CYTB5-A [Symbiodinium sp. CCMP2592]